MTIAAKVDLRNLFGPARDQGQRPTCMSFAASDAHAAVRGEWQPLSCEYAFYHAQRRAKRSAQQGATLQAMLDALRGDGQPAETHWPYLSTLPADMAQWKPPANDAPLFRRAGEAGSETVDAIVAELARGKPVITLMRLSRSFYRINTDGIVDEAPGEQPEHHRRHAVIAVGHGETKGQRIVLFRNSWGHGWGVQGYGWITERFLKPRVFRLATLKEDLSVSPGPVAA